MDPANSGHFLKKTKRCKPARTVCVKDTLYESPVWPLRLEPGRSPILESCEKSRNGPGDSLTRTRCHITNYGSGKFTV